QSAVRLLAEGTRMELFARVRHRLTSQSRRSVTATFVATLSVATRRYGADLSTSATQQHRVSQRPRAALSALCLDREVTSDEDVPRIASASREIAASAERIFSLIADPAQQPRWDGNDNLVEAA